MEKPIQLGKEEWWLDESSPLGKPGGFGAVFRGQSAKGTPVAIKRLHMEAEGNAHRELKVATELSRRDLVHVMPVFDAGQDIDSGRFYIVMPEASQSLQDLINKRSRLPDGEAAEIALAIARGLAEVPDLVRRDLKPANILLEGGFWRIADFGIAKFVEESTSRQTLRGFLSARTQLRSNGPMLLQLEHWTYMPWDVSSIAC